MTDRDDERQERRWDLIGAGVGALCAFADFALFRALGVSLTLGARDVTWLIALFFAISFAWLGWLAGQLYLGRRRAERDARVIADQYDLLRAAHAQVFEAEKLAAIGRLAAAVAHEVRNPLGVIRASASVVADAAAGSEDPDAARAAQFVVEEADRLDRLVEALLGFAKPTELTTRPISAAALLSEARSRARAQLTERGAACPIDIEGALGTVVADRDLIVAGLTGLIVNAAEAVAGAPAARVVLRAVPEEAGVVFEVIDSGPGVAPELAPRLFEPFVSDKAGGTGLGLATLARVAAAHGGEVSYLEGAGLGPDGEGACFCLHLPAAGSARGAA